VRDADRAAWVTDLRRAPPMSRRGLASTWTKAVRRGLKTLTRLAAPAVKRATRQTVRAVLKTVPVLPVLPIAPRPARRARPSNRSPDAGDWTAGTALGVAGGLRYRLYRPPSVKAGERLPLLVMLHGCSQDAERFAASTRMNALARRERFLVLYPEQDRHANLQGCWNWFDTRSGRAGREAARILAAVDQVCRRQPVDRACVAAVGLSAGASMAALLVTGHPERFQALVMHSGIAPGSAHSTLTALGAMRGHRLAHRLPGPAVLNSPGVAAVPLLGRDWPPLLVIHGDADGVVSPRNGPAAAQLWADATGARAGPTRRLQRGRRHAMAVTDFKRQGRTVVTLVTVAGLAHAWSGGAASQPFADAQGPDASRLAWAFAARQFGL
jgi:poly(hydroxyalkanoate) depolymerase family esterase